MIPTSKYFTDNCGHDVTYSRDTGTRQAERQQHAEHCATTHRWIAAETRTKNLRLLKRDPAVRAYLAAVRADRQLCREEDQEASTERAIAACAARPGGHALQALSHEEFGCRNCPHIEFSQDE